MAWQQALGALVTVLVLARAAWMIIHPGHQRTVRPPVR